MPADIPGGDFDSCADIMMDEEGHDEESAESICGALQAEAKSDHGDVDQLREALDRGAGLIADVGVDLVSGVDVPAVDSKWVMTKSGGARKGHDFRAESPVLLAKDADSDQRISYAAAMIPREPDKEGDVVATPTVEQAAHGFLKGDGGVDTDHSLIDGEGEVVESWVLKDERTFDLPGGETESYGPGTWMVGIEWGAEAWERIKAGDLTGLSIYGMAEHVPLSRRATCAECGDPVTDGNPQTADTHKGADGESGDMAPDQADGGGDTDDGETDGGPDIGEVAASVDDLAETVASIKDAVETEKQDEQELAAELGDVYDVPPGDVLDILSAASQHDATEVLEAIDSLSEQEPVEEEAEETKEDDDEDDEEEMENTAEKRADEANLVKGGDARQTAAKGIDAEPASGGVPSYAAAAEQQEADH